MVLVVDIPCNPMEAGEGSATVTMPTTTLSSTSLVKRKREFCGTPHLAYVKKTLTGKYFKLHIVADGRQHSEFPRPPQHSWICGPNKAATYLIRNSASSLLMKTR